MTCVLCLGTWSGLTDVYSAPFRVFQGDTRYRSFSSNYCNIRRSKNVSEKLLFLRVSKQDKALVEQGESEAAVINVRYTLFNYRDSTT